MAGAQTADFLFSLSNVVLIIGLSLTVVATIGAVWMANVREGYLKRDLAEADRRIAEANAAGEEARSAAADANARALEAALELERFRAPRILSEEQQQHVASRVREFAGQEYTAVLAAGGFDVGVLWTSLDRALTAAGWVRVPPAGLATGNPLAGVFVGEGSGIEVAVAPSMPAETVAAAQALLGALISVDFAARPGLQTDHKEKRENVVTIVIGLKPQ